MKAPWRESFLKHLAESGNVSASADAAGVGRRTVYEHREHDEDFAAAWRDAIDACADAAEGELYRRSVLGWDEPVFYQGKQCGTIRRYSDRLLLAFLAANRPEKYGLSAQPSQSGGVVILPRLEPTTVYLPEKDPLPT